MFYFPNQVLFSTVFCVFFVLELGGSSDSGRSSNGGSGSNRLVGRGLLRDLLGPSPTYGQNTGLPPSFLNLAPPTSVPSSVGPRPPTTAGDAPWSQAEAAYRQMITCPKGTGGPRGVVLLVPPTAGTGSMAYGRTLFLLDLPKYGFSPCWVDNPTQGTGDIQLTAEFVAYAVKYLALQSARPLAIVTYSQGGLDAQWALTFWPSIRRMVTQMITLAAPFRGTAAANLLCPVSELIGGCLPAMFQQSAGSNLVRALNAPGLGSGAAALVPTTSVYTLMDEVVIPQTGSMPASALPGASNIALQQICGPAHVADHFLIIGDPASYGIALDALLHGRPANPATVDRSYCNLVGSLLSQARNIGTDLEYALNTVIGNPGQRVSMLLKTLTTLRVPVEPPLQLYVCQRGLAVGCTGYGFNGQQPNAPLLSSIPGALRVLPSTLQNLLGPRSL